MSSSLCLKVQNNNKRGVKKALKKGADVNFINDEGDFALKIAAKSVTHYAIAEVLIKKGANVNLANNERLTALMTACSHGNIKLVGLLLFNEANINLKDSQGKSALMHLFISGQLEKPIGIDLVQFLLTNDANINDTDCSGTSVLMIASQKGNYKAVEILIKHGAQVNLVDKEEKSALLRACQSGWIKVAELLIKNEALVNIRDKKGRTPLMEACEMVEVDTSTIKLFLPNGAHDATLNIRDNKGMTALMIACEKGRLEYVELFVKSGANVNLQNFKGESALMIASEKGNLNIAKFLLDNGAHLKNNFGILKNREGGTANSKKERVQLLIKNGAKINLSNKNGESPLMRACENGLIEAAELLLQNGASVDLVDNEGQTALMKACRSGEQGIVELLLTYNGCVTLQDSRGQTALMVTQEFGVCSIKISQLLIKNNGAVVNLQDKDGITALMKACQRVPLSKEDIELLLNNKAQTTLQDKKGCTALMRLVKSSPSEIIQLVLSFDTAAQVNIQDNEGKTALLISCEGLNEEIIQLLLNNKAQVALQDNQGKTALMKLLQLSSPFEIIQLVLSFDTVDQINLRDNNGKTALMIACGSRTDKCAQLLLDSGAQAPLQDNRGRTALMMLVQLPGSVEAINSILACTTAGVNIKDSDGITALMFAQEIGSYSIIFTQKLLLKGAEVNLQDNNGRTALMRACESFKIQNVKILLKNNAQATLQDNKGETVLMKLCQSSSSRKQELIDLLLTSTDSAAHINLQDNNGRSAVMMACDSREINIVQLLLKSGANITLQDKEGKTVLMKLFSATLPTEIFQLVLAFDTASQINLQDREGKTVLIMACEAKREEYIKLFLNSGADVNIQDKRGLTALMIACDTWEDTVELLINSGARLDLVDNEGQTALNRACQWGREKDIKLLIKFSSETDINIQDNKGKSALMIMQEMGWTEITELLLNNGALVDLLDKTEESALMKACQSNSTECTKLLLKHGAQINFHAPKGMSALTIACENGDEDTTELLLSEKAEIDMRDGKGTTPLIVASYNGQTAIANLLVNKGAHLDIQDDEGHSALMAACQEGHVETVSRLLDESPDTFLKNKEGKTAFDIALDNNKMELQPLFYKLRSRPLYPEILFLEGAKRETIVTVGNTINLEEIGISLTIPEDAIPDTDSPPQLEIQPCFSGPFEIPENIELVSPAYIVKPNGIDSFKKEVFVKIWHHANLETEEDCEDMVFLSASTTPEYRGNNPVYFFKEIGETKGVFRPGEEQPVGEIALKHFCTLALGKRKHKDDGESEQEATQSKRTKGNLYSARLYKSIGTKIIFCICLCQPQYIKNCDRVISQKYEGNFTPKALNGVTIKDDEVFLKSTGTNDWKTCFDRVPPSISEGDILFYESYEIGDSLDMDYPPRIEINIRNSPHTADAEPLLLHVEGLNRAYAFTILPEDYLKPTLEPVVDTSKMKCAMVELEGEISKAQMQTTALSIAAEMLRLMKCVEENLSNQAAGSFVAHTLEEMAMKSQQLKESTNTPHHDKEIYGLKIHVEAVGSFLVQLKIIYAGNIKHSITNTPEWQAATSLFVANAANLMTSIKSVLLASEHCHRAPSPAHQPHVATYQPHHCSTSDLRVRDCHPLPINTTSSISLLNLPTSPLMASRTSTAAGFCSSASHQPEATVPLLNQSPQHVPVSSAASIMISHPVPNNTTEDTVISQLAPSTSPAPYSTMWNTPADAHSPPSTSAHLPPPSTNALSTNASGITPEQHPPMPLNKDHTAEVFHCLYSLRAKWKTIGTFLCIDHSHIESIKADNEDSADRLTELIAVWLRRHTPPPTWQALADAVQYIDPDKAQEIRQNVT